MFLSSCYYHDANGDKNTVLQNLGDCYTRNIFFVLKNEIHEDKLMKGYVDDFGFAFERLNGGAIQTIYNHDIKSPSCYAKVKNYRTLKNDGTQAIEIIESLLEQNEIVFANTFMRRLPFYKSYQEIIGSEYNDVIDGHIFLLLGHQDDSLYYLENYVNLNQNFVPYEGNASIGVESKAVFGNAFHYQFSCFTIEPNRKELLTLDDRIPSVLGSMIKSYNKPAYVNKLGHQVFYGRAAIEEMISICNEGLLRLTDKIPNRDHDFYSLSRTIFNRVVSRKRLFLHLLSRCDAVSNGNTQEKVIDALKNNLNTWETMIALMTKKYALKDYTLHADLMNRFVKILAQEDSLYEILEEQYDTICSSISG